MREVPSVIQDEKLIIRGTPEWEMRELAREEAGACCLSYGNLWGRTGEWAFAHNFEEDFINGD